MPARLVQFLRLLWLLGVVLAFVVLKRFYFIFTDGAVYATLGKHLAEGVGLKYCGATHLFYPPGYPLAISFFYLGLGDAELSAHWVSLIAYLLSIPLMARLAWSLRPTPLFTGLSTAVVTLHPFLILNAGYVMPESLFVCVILGSSYCAWKLARETNTALGWWGLWGALGGFAYLIRADGILYWPLQALFIFAFRRETFRILAVKCLLGSLFLFLVAFPYLLLIKQTTGRWQISTKTSIILEYSRQKTADSSGKAETKYTSTLGADGKTFALDRSQETFASFLLGKPKEAARRVFFNLKQLLRQKGITFGWIDIVLFLLIWIALGRRLANPKTFFVLLHLSPIVLFLFLYIDPRFLVAFVPYIALGTARAGEVGWDWANGVFGRKKYVVASCLVVLALGLGGLTYGPRALYHAQKFLNTRSTLPLEHKEMGIWMKEHLTILPTTRITHRNPWVSFYAGGCHARSPFFDNSDPAETLKRLVDWCRETDVRYLVVDERMTKPNTPGLAFLLDDSKKYPGLKPLHAIAGTDPKIVLYAVLPSE